VAVARRYEADPRVRVVVNERNLGDYPNRNRAALLARGEFLKYHDSDDVMYPHCLATMLAPLRAEPRAALALSASWSWPGGPCPMLLSPRMAYQREFLGGGLFMGGPSAGLFRADDFRRVGGFPERGVGSDYLFWLDACARLWTLLVPGDLYWYRTHQQQELVSPMAAREYAMVAGEAWRALESPTCPLTPEERETARRNVAYNTAKLCVRDVRRGRAGIARVRLAHANLGWRDWVRYLRPPRRRLLAGTPLDEGRDYVIPGWPGERTGPSTSIGRRT
jgi:glycosyltransferase involved in cell wall biosynthesis